MRCPSPGRWLVPALEANLTPARAGEQASLLALPGSNRLPAALATIRAFPTHIAAGIACPSANAA